MKQLTELKAGETYVFIGDVNRQGYLDNWPTANAGYIEKFYDDGFTLVYVDNDGYGWIGHICAISPKEMKYFKLKETKMKATDTINVPMTALQGLMLRVLVGRASSTGGLYKILRDDLGLPVVDTSVTYDVARDWREGEELHTWALAQFNDPKQDKIDELEKTINDAASELAKLKVGES